MPYWLMAGGMVLIALSWVPLVFFARARNKESQQTRVQIFQDMGRQPKYKAEAGSDIFADGRAMRPVIPGTVARGSLQADDHYHRGYSYVAGPSTRPAVKYHDGIPLAVTSQFLRRGQERYGIYCAPCHGMDGTGDGPISVRALELNNNINTKSLHDLQVVSQPDGQIYNTINNGIRNMPAYGAQVPVEDRWAIVAYVRALQLTQTATTRPMPAGAKD